MASETKTGASRKTGTSTPAPKVAKKAAAKTVAATGKTAKTITTKKTATPAAAEKPATRKATPRKAPGQPITADARLRHIEVAAYYIAENSGFSRSPADCWVAAESEVDGLLLGGKL